MQFEYYHSRESGQFTFYRIPKALFTDAAFHGLSTDAKLLYGLMLDRIGLSVRSGWVDEQDRVYIYFSHVEIMEQLQCGHNKAVRLLKELDQGLGLIRRKRQGLGKPDRIYVMNFISGTEDQTSEKGNSDGDAPAEVSADTLQDRENQSSENGNSGSETSFFETSEPPVSGAPAFPKGERIKNDINNTYQSDTESIHPIQSVPEDRMDGSELERTEALLRDRWGYMALLDNYSPSELDGLISMTAAALSARDPTIRVGKLDLPREKVRDKLLSLDFTHIDYVLECLHKTRTPIRNMRSYLLTALYNAPNTIDAYYENQVAQHEGIT